MVIKKGDKVKRIIDSFGSCNVGEIYEVSYIKGIDVKIKGHEDIIYSKNKFKLQESSNNELEIEIW